ncbi:MAG: glycogen debranching enzyme, partial [Microcystaceae cyanobacterium]
IYHRPDTDVNRSINFITCHDGFTLKDLVSYNEKHNEANRESNRDGANDNFSWNCGVEGVTNNQEIESLRLQQIKNLFTILLISQGTPMMLMCDEVQRTQRGNNNAYCQDNELAWFDWDLVDKHFDLWCFVRRMINFSKSLALFKQENLLDIAKDSPYPHLTWHGIKLYQPDWSKDSHTLVFSLKHTEAGEYLHVMFNAYWEQLTFELPSLPDGQNWHRVVDTTLPLMEAVADMDTATVITDHTYQVAARSSVVLIVKSY